MKILISPVGGSDPFQKTIQSGKERVSAGALLYLVEQEKPNKIVLLYSSKFHELKHCSVKKAIETLKKLGDIDKNTDIEVFKEKINDDDIADFDKMYNYVSLVFKEYNNSGNELVLNLTSGTKQLSAALWAFNLVEGHNVRAVNAGTPEKGANERNIVETDIDKLISEYLETENKKYSDDRSVTETYSKFKDSLQLSHLRELIDKYDYQAVLEVVETNTLFGDENKNQLLKEKLEPIVTSIKTQKILPELDRVEDLNQQRAFNAFLLLDLSYKRGLVADILIKAKSIAELILEAYLNKLYPGIIVECNGYAKMNTKLNKNNSQDFIQKLSKKLLKGKDYIENKDSKSGFNLSDYLKMLDKLEPKSNIIDYVTEINEWSLARNQVAHNFAEITEPINKIFNLIKAVKNLLANVFEIKETDELFSYFELKNNEIKNDLHN